MAGKMPNEEISRKCLAYGFPFWNELTPEQQESLCRSTRPVRYEKGEHVHSPTENCVGILLVRSGQLRAYILSDEGREITIYRLFDRDLCLLSASCIMRSIQFDVTI